MNDRMIEIWNSKNFVVLDTETTGLKAPCEIIDIAILNADGQTILSSLVKPRRGIPDFIQGLTGIRPEDSSSSSTWPTIRDFVINAIKGKVVITYNATFDRQMFHCSDDTWELSRYEYKHISTWECAMTAYAPYHGDWNSQYNDWRWAKLTDAMHEQKLPVVDAHRAYGDALMTWKLLEHMCTGGQDRRDTQ